MGEALQVPRPARDIHEAVAKTPPVHPGRVRRPLEAAPRTGAFDLVREYALPIPLTIVRDSQATAVNDAKSAARLGLRAVPAVAGHGYCAPRRAFLRAKGSPPSSRAAPGATSMTRIMLMKLMSRCRPTAPRENAYSMSAPTAGPAIAT